ncbi:16679_t:CDS:2, partial [Acaulospora colombiana]
MSSYVYELPTTGSIVFGDFIVDQIGKYSHTITNATSVVGLQADLAFSLLTYASALSNLAASSVNSLGLYERERAITDTQRKVKDEKLNFSVQLLLKAA